MQACPAGCEGGTTPCLALSKAESCTEAAAPADLQPPTALQQSASPVLNSRSHRSQELLPPLFLWGTGRVCQHSATFIYPQLYTDCICLDPAQPCCSRKRWQQGGFLAAALVSLWGILPASLLRLDSSCGACRPRRFAAGNIPPCPFPPAQVCSLLSVFQDSCSLILTDSRC